MPGVRNPPASLEGGEVKNACIPEADGRLFSNILEAAKLVANRISQLYPALMEMGPLASIRSTPPGSMVHAYLSAVAYSYWDGAPVGPGVYEMLQKSLLGPLPEVVRQDCHLWGDFRLNCEPHGPHSTLYVVEDTPKGSVISNSKMDKFYLVAGLFTSPAAALTTAGIKLPAAARLTALPFRGVYVYDGMLAGGSAKPVNDSIASKLRQKYAAAKANNRIITGVYVPESQTRAGAVAKETVPMSSVKNMSVSELKTFISVRGGSTDGCFEKKDLVARADTLRSVSVPEESEGVKRTLKEASGSMPSLGATAPCKFEELSNKEKAIVESLRAATKQDSTLVFRRMGYTEESNAGHSVAIMLGSSCAGIFQSKGLVPTGMEVAKELSKIAKAGTICKMVAVDNLHAGKAADRITCHAGIHVGYYPPPSFEEQAFLSCTPPEIVKQIGRMFGATD